MPVAGVAKSVERRPDSLPDHALGPPPVEYSLTGLTITRSLTFEEWAHLGGTLGSFASALPWLIGDWILHGEAAYGETYSQALDVTGLSYDTLAHYAHVARCFDSRRRHQNLSWQAHREVAGLEPTEADALLDRAAAEGLRSRDLRALVRERRTLAAPDELVSITLRLPRAAAARLHELAGERTVSEAVAELVNGDGG
jgi:hypothetical protein